MLISNSFGKKLNSPDVAKKTKIKSFVDLNRADHDKSVTKK